MDESLTRWEWTTATGASVATAVVAAILGSLTLSPTFAVVVLMLAVVVFVVPHGATDLVLITRRAATEDRDALPIVLLAYTALAVSVAALWWVTPAASLAAFIAITAYHFGQGDAWAHGVGPHDPRYAPLVVGLGLLPVTLPFWLAPADVAFVFELVASGLGGTVSAPALLYQQAGALGAMLAGACIAIALVWSSREERLRLLTDTLSCLVLFSVVHPAIAIALYLAGWHSTRHIVRAANALGGEARYRRIAVGSLPAVLGSLALSALALTTLPDSSSMLTAIGPTLAVLAGLTVPHVIVVTWLDRRGARTKLGPGPFDRTEGRWPTAEVNGQ